MPGPLGTDTNSPVIDEGTLALTRTRTPGTIATGALSSQERIAEAIRRSLPMLPAEARQQVEALLTPEALTLVAGTLVLWAGSHLVGVGEIVDVILLAVGFALLGTAVVSGADELYRFATTAAAAQTDADLDRAARHFAAAVTLLGISVVSALLLRKSAGGVASRGRPQVRKMPEVGRPPAAGVKPQVSRPYALPDGAAGLTDAWGNISVSRSQVLSEQQVTLYHEWVHSVLSPKLAPMRQLRAQLRMSGYMRSALLRYLEEALAESYAQLRMVGAGNLIVGIRFPLAYGYVTVSQLAAEGVAIGNITFGGARFTVWLSTDGSKAP